jgi:hypothetical protein
MLASVVILVGCLGASVNGQRGRFNPDGAFWIIGEPPAAFSNFGGINLNSNRSRRLPASGVDLTDGTRFKFKTLTVARNKLVFSTVTRRGVFYRFQGKFLKGGDFSAQDLQEQPVLEGILTKIVDGRKVSEAMLRFSYFGGT